MKRFFLALVPSLLALTLYGQNASTWSAVVSPSGGVRVEHDGREFGLLVPGLFETDWRSATMNTGKGGEVPKDGLRRGQIIAPSGSAVSVETRATIAPNGARLNYRLTPQKNLKLNSLHVALVVPTHLLTGGKYIADGEETEFPAQFKDVGLRSAPTKSLKLVCADGGTLIFDFADPTPVLIQDDRQWGETFTVRIGPQMSGEEIWAAGKSLDLNFALTAGGKLKIEDDGPVMIRASDEWLPLEEELDIEPNSALDFANLVPRAPAGKFGRVLARNGHFVFEKKPNTPVRFYGTNLCFGANYLPHDQADRLAERLMRLGYNAVRIHHYEGELVDRSKGDSTTLRPDKLDQFDYLFAALKQRGLYVTTDLFVSRPVFNNEIWEGEKGDIGMDQYKLAVHFNDRAFENFKAFSRALLDHENPYTKLRYADDPALAWISLVNEDNPGNFASSSKGRLREDIQRAWNQWLAARHPDREALAKALGKLTDAQDPAKSNIPLPNSTAGSPAAMQFSIFLAETERDFFLRTRTFLRAEFGCRALLTDCNAWTNPVQLQAARQSFDYVDDHFYVDHPEFLERPWSLPSRCSNASPVAGGASGGRSDAFTRLLDKPMTITEFNYAAPSRYRGVGGILTGALGAVQDWSGIWRFAYSHSPQNTVRPGALGYFDMASDPLGQAAERASLCLFLRGDLAPAKHTVAIAASEDELLKNPKTSREKTPPWSGLAWVTRVGWLIVPDPAKAKGADTILALSGENAAFTTSAGDTTLASYRDHGWLADTNVTVVKKNVFQNENGEIIINAPENILTLDTARTAGGFAPAGKKIETKAATIEMLDTDATVWVSALDDKPIGTSKHLLITHLTDLQNTNARFGDRTRQILQDWGKLPHLVRAGRATVTLHIKNADKAKVYALATNGKRLDEVAAKSDDSTLTVPLSVAADGKARMLYEVELAR